MYPPTVARADAPMAESRLRVTKSFDALVGHLKVLFARHVSDRKTLPFLDYQIHFPDVRVFDKTYTFSLVAVSNETETCFHVCVNACFVSDADPEVCTGHGLNPCEVFEKESEGRLIVFKIRQEDPRQGLWKVLRYLEVQGARFSVLAWVFQQSVRPFLEGRLDTGRLDVHVDVTFGRRVSRGVGEAMVWEAKTLFRSCGNLLDVVSVQPTFKRPRHSSD